MSVITNYELRHSIHNDEISVGRMGIDDTSADSASICSSSSISSSYEENVTIAPKSSPQHKRWKIDASEISELPEIYPRLSSPLIVRDREIAEIGDRLLSFLRFNEIRSAYDPEEGRVLCFTNRVSFVVQFWRRKVNESSSTGECDVDEEIILEIQRRKGCGWTMHKIRAAMKKWVLRKYYQRDNSRYHHRISRFPPPLQRSKSERFGLIGFDPKFLASDTKPLHTDAASKTCVTAAHDVSSSKPIPFFELPCSSSMAPLQPTFGVCPPPVWRSVKVPSSEQYQFTIFE